MPAAGASKALVAQGQAVIAWVDALDEGAYDLPSVLSGWRVAELVAHVAQVLDGIVDVAETRGERPLPMTAYFARYREAADTIRDQAISATESRSPAQIADSVRQGLTKVTTLLAAESQAPVVVGGRGPIRWTDYLLTRVVELVVHADDLGRSVPAAAPPALDRAALRLTCLALARALAEKAPGRSVELRIPPYAAVQCVEGPRHTRGTPPNVVEIDPVTWVRMASDRVGWLGAVSDHLVHVSGSRADLGAWLPVL